MPRRSYPRKKRGSLRPPRRLSVRSQLRAEPDVRKYARAVIALAIAQAERDAAAQREQQDTSHPVPSEAADD